MMINPPIDKLIEKIGCKFSLCCLISKRARYLQDKMPALLEEKGIKNISYAADELYNDTVSLSYEQ